MKTLEDFLNAQTDWNWSWGPLLHLRPPKHVKMGARLLWGFYVPTAVITVAGCIAGIAFLWMYWPEVFGSHRPPGVVPSWTLYSHLVRWVCSQPDYRRALSAGFIGGCLMIGAYFWAWNRRATRFGQANEEIKIKEGDGIWPPPPQRPIA